MSIQNSYDAWANQYDNNKNKTRDIEAIALREELSNITFQSCLEIGCGTGKNTEWLLTKAANITAVDFSEQMLLRAKEKIASHKAQFFKADINNAWNFATTQFDIAVFSLVLEHIENLNEIFKNLHKIIKPNGWVYIGELHPFKQYAGTKARFETEDGTEILKCFTHNISEFIIAAKSNNFSLIDINEYFDEGDKKNIPRVLTLLFKKNEI